jgi:hypothetical protein
VRFSYASARADAGIAHVLKEFFKCGQRILDVLCVGGWERFKSGPKQSTSLGPYALMFFCAGRGDFDQRRSGVAWVTEAADESSLTQFSDDP